MNQNNKIFINLDDDIFLFTSVCIPEYIYIYIYADLNHIYIQ